MRMTAIALATATCSLVLLAASASAQIICGDCETCYSAPQCDGKVIGTICAGCDPVSWCHDLEKEDCPSNICCCGCYGGQRGEARYEVPVPIPDNDPIGFGNAFVFAETGTVLDVDVILEIDHSHVGDLFVTLTHNGFAVVLMARPGYPELPMGCDADLLCGQRVRFTDGGMAPIQCPSLDCEACFPGGQVSGDVSYAPPVPLNLFDGMDVSGSWELSVKDMGEGGTGQICALTLLAVTHETTAVSPDSPFSWGTVKAIYR